MGLVVVMLDGHNEALRSMQKDEVAKRSRLVSAERMRSS